MINWNKMQREVKIAYVGGGSHAWAWVFMADLAKEKQLKGTVCLYDIDIEAAQTNEKIGRKLFEREDVEGSWIFESSVSLQEALTGADFVIISILPGTFDEMESDVHLPERYGIYQSVGDTAGPGGLIRALRTIPMYVEIGEAVKKYCPDAWVISYTNPMTLCVQTLYHVFPEIKAFGCCHEVFGTQKVLRDIVQMETGIQGINREEIIVDVVGINHFTWFTKASYKEMDLFPMYKSFIEKNFDEGYHDPDRNWMNGTFNCAHRVKFDLFRKYGAIAAAGDRHLAEFMPGDIYLKNPKTVEDWKFALTTVAWRKERQMQKNYQAKRLASGEEQLELADTGEEGLRLIKALCGMERFVTNVNIPNFAGQIPNFPKNAVVETNAVFSRDSIAPVYAGKCPDVIEELIHPHIKNHKLILEAALECNFDKAYAAFVNDPLVKGRIGYGECEELLAMMIKNTIKYLPDKWSKL